MPQSSKEREMQLHEKALRFMLSGFTHRENDNSDSIERTASLLLGIIHPS